MYILNILYTLYIYIYIILYINMKKNKKENMEKMKYKYEKKNLDVTIKLNKNQFVVTDVVTDFHQYLHHNSCHPALMKKCSIYSCL